jgi:hypothetical protein
LPTDPERVELLVIRSRELLIDHLVIRLKLAINSCKIGIARVGDDRLPYLRMAQRAYAGLQQDSYRQTYSRPTRVITLLETLRLQLVELEDGQDQNELRDDNAQLSLKHVVRSSDTREPALAATVRAAKLKVIDSCEVLNQTKKDALIGEIQDLLDLQNCALAHLPFSPNESREFNERKSYIRVLVASLVRGADAHRPKPLTCGCASST